MIKTSMLCLVVAVLSGCSVNIGAPETDSEPTAPTTSSSSRDATEVFLEIVREEFPDETMTVDDDTLLAVGKANCEMLDLDIPHEEIAQLGLDNGVSLEMTGYIVGASISTLCPEHEDTMPD